MSMSGKQLVWSIVAIIAIIPIAQFISREVGEAQDSSATSASPIRPSFADTEVVVSRQASEGITEADFSQQFLTNLEAWTIERTTANAKKYWDAASISEKDARLSGESVFIERFGHQLAVIRIKIGGTTPAATIVGVKGDEIFRITCVDRSGRSVSVTAGPCDEKIREVFSAR